MWKLMLKFMAMLVMIFVVYFAWIGYAKSEMSVIVIGETYNLGTMFCDTAEQVIEVTAVYDSQGQEAARRKADEMNKDKVQPVCVLETVNVIPLEVVAQYKTKNGQVLNIVQVAVVYPNGTFYPEPQYVAIYNEVREKTENSKYAI